MLYHLKVTILFCALLASADTLAQSVKISNAKLVLSPGTEISIRGNVENSGTITNNGHLKVSGQWVNSGVYSIGSGELTFNSSSLSVPQVIHHNGQAIQKLTIAGGSKKTILSDMVIGSEINFQDGVVETSGDTKIFFGPGVSISGGSDASHIHGPVYQRGSGTKLFPIGNGLTYLPVELLEVEDENALVGVRAFEFANLSLTKPPSLSAISNNRYWHLDVTSGSVENSRIVLPVRGELLPEDSKSIVVAQASSLTGLFTSIGQSFFEGEVSNGRVASGKKITMPFVALATVADDAYLVVHNAVSPNGDQLNDVLTIANIEMYPENKVTLFSRWGDKIFEMDNYDNHSRVFGGRSNLHGEKQVVSGNYFYVIEIPGMPTLRGFITLRND
jgi:gliding motility-associated-like protein